MKKKNELLNLPHFSALSLRLKGRGRRGVKKGGGVGS